MTERVCFQLQVRPERLEEYRREHAAVWPDMLEALNRCGWRNYSLFVRSDGLLIGYFETHDYAAAIAQMASTEVNARWQQHMSGFFELAQRAGGDGLLRLTEVFNLDDQMGRLK